MTTVENEEVVEHGAYLSPSAYQHEKLHAFQDSFAVLLQSPTEEIRVTSTYHGFWFLPRVIISHVPLPAQ